MRCGAATEGLCALQGSSGSQVTRSADGRDMIEPALPLIGWDPGRPNALHHLLTHPTLPRNHATTTANFIVPLPTLNPSASMRDSQDTDHDVFDKDAVEDGLSDCETVFACPGYDDDGSTFDDDIDVAGESSETCPFIWPTMIEGDDWAVLEEDFEEDFDGDDLDTHEPGD